MKGLEQYIVTDDPDTMTAWELKEWSLANIMTAWAKRQNTDLPDLVFVGMFHMCC